MKTQLIYLVICLILVNCKESKPDIALKFSDKPVAINCDIDHSELFNEALYNFEENLFENHNVKNPNLNNAFRDFLKTSINNAANYNNITNQHSLDIYKALRNIEGLYLEKDNNVTLNYNHEIFSCIGENIQDKDLKATFNALLSTNSMSLRMLKDVFINKSGRINSDKYLTTFVALELYYSKLADVDLSKKHVKPIETLKEDNDPHAGHNHD